jgi:enterochelin esterase-like enzyme
VVLQIAAVVALVAAIGWRDRTWRLRRLPIAVAGAALLALLAATHSVQITGDRDPLPVSVWVWLGVAAGALLVLAVGWRSARWWRRGTAVAAAALAALVCANGINQFVGYYPTLGQAINSWAGKSAVPGLVTLPQVRGITGKVAAGRVVEVTIPSTYSHFPHRPELVYLPPIWFDSPHRPALPAVELIAGEHGTPEDWERIGHAVRTTDAYAEAHHGWAPILVFADATGNWFNDTECVNGPHGDAEDHLLRDIPSYVEKTFGASAKPGHWGVLGFSMGGTCAIDLVLDHPSTFWHFADISGDIGPNLGDKQHTIRALFGGSYAEWEAHDPLTVLGRHPHYPAGVSGWFEAGNRETVHIDQAYRLAEATRSDGIPTWMTIRPGGHVWQFGTAAFADILPWMAEQLGLPDAGPVAAPNFGQSVRALPQPRLHRATVVQPPVVRR